MAILINLNDARKKLNELEGSAEYNKGVTDAFNALFDLPTIEAEPKHAYVTVDEDGNIECSNCGSSNCFDNYCGHCGAKMTRRSNEYKLHYGATPL